MRIVCISDTHHLENHMKEKIPEGDVLVHSGDFTNVGSKEDVVAFNNWIGKLPHKYKIVIAGNHDWLLYNKKNARKFLTNCIYLEDEETIIDGKIFYGSPWTPIFFCWAFMGTERELKEKWDNIPDHTDVLITHGPPYGILDRNIEGYYTGSKALIEKVLELKPKLHIFGHIHESYGVKRNDFTCFVNASTCNRSYVPVNKPIVVDI
jgi:Icc-related predicted phosphoesterase